MLYEEGGLVKAGTNVYYVAKVKELPGGGYSVRLMNVKDGVLLPLMTQDELVAEKFQMMSLIPKRMGSHLQKATRAKYRRNSWVKHVKTGGLYQIVQTPEYRYLEATGECCYEYRNGEGFKFNRCQVEMEDGRFEPVSLAEIRVLLSGLAHPTQP